MAQPLAIVHTEDPALPIIRETGHLLEDVVIPPTDLLLVMYEPDKEKGDKRTRGGIILPEGDRHSISEGKHQGKAGLVMKLGAMAFKDDDTHKWHDFRPKLHDWVVINVGDSFSYDMTGARRVRQVHES